jgi:hypothetical protein
VPDHYYDWKAIDVDRAIKAIAASAVVFKLPSRFGNGQACYGHGLQTKRGTCYLVSDRVMKYAGIPAVN